MLRIRLRIKELAEEKKMSQSRLQREAGVTMPQLRRYWSNNTESVTLDALARIARALGVGPLALMEEVQVSEDSEV